VRVTILLVFLSLLLAVEENRIEECNVTETEEVDSEGFITVRTRKTKQAIKRSKQVNERSDRESKKSKVVSGVILLKQSS
jgi:hypothetical protein